MNLKHLGLEEKSGQPVLMLMSPGEQPDQPHKKKKRLLFENTLPNPNLALDLQASKSALLSVQQPSVHKSCSSLPASNETFKGLQDVTDFFYKTVFLFPVEPSQRSRNLQKPPKHADTFFLFATRTQMKLEIFRLHRKLTIMKTPQEDESLNHLAE